MHPNVWSATGFKTPPSSSSAIYQIPFIFRLRSWIWRCTLRWNHHWHRKSSRRWRYGETWNCLFDNSCYKYSIQVAHARKLATTKNLRTPIFYSELCLFWVAKQRRFLGLMGKVPVLGCQDLLYALFWLPTLGLFSLFPLDNFISVYYLEHSYT